MYCICAAVCISSPAVEVPCGHHRGQRRRTTTTWLPYKSASWMEKWHLCISLLAGVCICEAGGNGSGSPPRRGFWFDRRQYNLCALHLATINNILAIPWYVPWYKKTIFGSIYNKKTFEQLIFDFLFPSFRSRGKTPKSCKREKMIVFL